METSMVPRIAPEQGKAGDPGQADVERVSVAAMLEYEERNQVGDARVPGA
jgi:hypothetical protein